MEMPDNCRRSGAAVLMARLIAKIASIRRTASAVNGALANSASSENLRRPCNPATCVGDWGRFASGREEVVVSGVAWACRMPLRLQRQSVHA